MLHLHLCPIWCLYAVRQDDIMLFWFILGTTDLVKVIRSYGFIPTPPHPTPSLSLQNHPNNLVLYIYYCLYLIAITVVSWASTHVPHFKGSM